MKIGILTSGGDCPGLNAVIRAIVRKADLMKFETIGIKNAWKGLFDESYIHLNLNSVGRNKPGRHYTRNFTFQPFSGRGW